ncbi:hypothetical protein K458DRAFT_400558 [Lentithecium fluviatile CBS 122367]|uniref:C2H2-type domain-containing protein n=1 Tax=Lentithecium fluviatile CBS 122367 TaxID=1168545 RepID=A0A6G1JDY6_9PLEO|nr:hypothetical protein K458DRAFT_400558 [Lentithecium fluviatile CBS 122367]
MRFTFQLELEFRRGGAVTEKPPKITPHATEDAPPDTTKTPREGSLGHDVRRRIAKGLSRYVRTSTLDRLPSRIDAPIIQRFTTERVELEANIPHKNVPQELEASSPGSEALVPNSNSNRRTSEHESSGSIFGLLPSTMGPLPYPGETCIAAESPNNPESGQHLSLTPETQVVSPFHTKSSNRVNRSASSLSAPNLSAISQAGIPDYPDRSTSVPRGPEQMQRTVVGSRNAQTSSSHSLNPNLKCDQCPRIFRGHDQRRKLIRHQKKLHGLAISDSECVAELEVTTASESTHDDKNFVQKHFSTPFKSPHNLSADFFSFDTLVGSFDNDYSLHTRPIPTDLRIFEGDEHDFNAPKSHSRERAQSILVPIKCDLCSTKFKGTYQRGNLKRHMRLAHSRALRSNSFLECRSCPISYKRADARRKHEWKMHKIEDCRPEKRRLGKKGTPPKLLSYDPEGNPEKRIYVPRNEECRQLQRQRKHRSTWWFSPYLNRL